MRMNRDDMKIIAGHLENVTDGRIALMFGDGPDGRGYRVTMATNPTARMVTWHSVKRHDARRAMVYMLGALGAYADTTEEAPMLRDLRAFLAWRPEMAEALKMGQEDGRAARTA